MPAKSKLALIIYALLLVLDLYTMKYQDDLNKTRQASNAHEKYKIMGQKWYCFFTIWTFGAQMFFLTVSIIDELGKLLKWFTPKRQKTVNFIRAYHFHLIVLPCSLVVVSIFWTLFNYDRELIFPKELDEFLPKWCNHVLHTVIIVPIIIELFVLPKQYNFIQFKSIFIGLTIYLFAYQLMYSSVYVFHNVWLYPIYGYLTWPQKVLFTLLQYGIGILFQYGGVWWQNRKKIVKRNE